MNEEDAARLVDIAEQRELLALEGYTSLFGDHSVRFDDRLSQLLSLLLSRETAAPAACVHTAIDDELERHSATSFSEFVDMYNTLIDRTSHGLPRMTRAPSHIKSERLLRTRSWWKQQSGSPNKLSVSSSPNRYSHAGSPDRPSRHSRHVDAREVEYSDDDDSAMLVVQSAGGVPGLPAELEELKERLSQVASGREEDDGDFPYFSTPRPTARARRSLVVDGPSEQRSEQTQQWAAATSEIVDFADRDARSKARSIAHRFVPSQAASVSGSLRQPSRDASPERKGQAGSPDRTEPPTPPDGGIGRLSPQNGRRGQTRKSLLVTAKSSRGASCRSDLTEEESPTRACGTGAVAVSAPAQTGEVEQLHAVNVPMAEDSSEDVLKSVPKAKHPKRRFRARKLTKDNVFEGQKWPLPSSPAAASPHPAAVSKAQPSRRSASPVPVEAESPVQEVADAALDPGGSNGSTSVPACVPAEEVRVEAAATTQVAATEAAPVIEAAVAVEAAAPDAASVPTETAVPVEVAAPIEAAAPAEPPAPGEAMGPVEVREPVEAAATPEITGRVEAASSVEAGAAAEEAAAPVERAAPVEAATPAEAAAPMEDASARRIEAPAATGLEAPIAEGVEPSPAPSGSGAACVDSEPIINGDHVVKAEGSCEQNARPPLKKIRLPDEPVSGERDVPASATAKGCSLATNAMGTNRDLLKLRGSATLAAELGDTDGTEATASFDTAIVGTYSCHGCEPGPEQGSVDKINQDCACIVHPAAHCPGAAFFAVFDGHGKHGHAVSQEVLHSLYFELEQQAELLMEEPLRAMADAFQAVQEHLVLMSVQEVVEVDSRSSGACGLCCFLHERNLHVANAGDCRAVLGTRCNGDEITAVALSTDHKCSLPSEQERIEAAGGYVRPEFVDEDGEVLPARLYKCKDRMFQGPGLCVARGFGDLDAVCCGLVPTPEIVWHAVQPEDEFLIMASDGVWEFIENEKAVRLVGGMYKDGKTAEEACRFLILQAAIAWRMHEGNYRDDITAIVVYLQEAVACCEEEARQRATGA